ncbi:MAG TPA: Dabb family protein [Verrucomicrobiae bacterium]|nr:Dabb family protein [Verrucomicrobiae bacterium]
MPDLQAQSATKQCNTVQKFEHLEDGANVPPLRLVVGILILAAFRPLRQNLGMFSHVVIFWTHRHAEKAAEELIAGARQLLPPIPGVLQFHAGKMVPSHRPVVDQSYQVALNLVFPTKKAQDDYQTHPAHLEFVEKYVKRLAEKVLVYDFE